MLLGCLATVFITSKTEPLDAWLSSLDRVNTRGDSHNSGIDHSVESTAIPPPSSGVRLRKQQQLTPSSSASRTTATGTTCSGRDHLDRHADQKVDPALDLVTSKPLGNGVEHEAHEGGHLIAPQIPGGGGGGEDIGPSVVKKGERVLVAMVLALSLLFAYLSALVGSSDLLGCFLGGLAFSAVPGVQSIWGRQVRRLLKNAKQFFAKRLFAPLLTSYERRDKSPLHDAVYRFHSGGRTACDVDDILRVKKMAVCVFENTSSPIVQPNHSAGRHVIYPGTPPVS